MFTKTCVGSEPLTCPLQQPPFSNNALCSEAGEFTLTGCVATGDFEIGCDDGVDGDCDGLDQGIWVANAFDGVPTVVAQSVLNPGLTAAQIPTFELTFSYK